MATRVLQVKGASTDELSAGVAAIQQEQGLSPDFPADVERAAEQAARSPRLPATDLTHLELVTIDPVGAMDLDQAMHLAADGDGYVVHYAIADLMAFLAPGDPVDEEAHRRGESLYGADSKIPLHPKVLSEGAASLLPDQERPAFVWTIRLDATGETRDATVQRARVRSRQRLDYESVQRAMGQAPAGSTLALLRTVGELRIAKEAERGGVSLPMPAQEIDVRPDGRWLLEFRDMLPVEDWNAQISLLTGFAAASIMVKGQVGILRTLPPAPEYAVTKLRRTARALGIDWPSGQSHPDFIRSLDPSHPAEAAMVVACTALLRGAGYAAFDGHVPEQPEHAALASTYAHVTAPLRRLVDRYGLEICTALSAGEPVPQWVLDRLDDLPDTMRESGRKSHAYENAVLNLVEAWTLQSRIGETFAGVVTEVEQDDERKGTVMVREPAVEATVTSSSPLPVGQDVTVTLTDADPVTRKVRFSL
ncbi:MAG: ribonuclease [Marmoricola sp.]|nr:ribonuclease [Marmoricola sp.]